MAMEHFDEKIAPNLRDQVPEVSASGSRRFRGVHVHVNCKFIVSEFLKVQLLWTNRSQCDTSSLMHKCKPRVH